MRSTKVVKQQLELAERVYDVAVVLHEVGATMTYGRLVEVTDSPFFAHSNEFGEVLAMLTLSDPERMEVFVLAATGKPSPIHYEFIDKSVWKRKAKPVAQERVCDGCGGAQDQQWIEPHRNGGWWHADWCMPPPSWTPSEKLKSRS